jgi:hypothetical protein
LKCHRQWYGTRSGAKQGVEPTQVNIRVTRADWKPEEISSVIVIEAWNKITSDIETFKRQYKNKCKTAVELCLK